MNFTVANLRNKKVVLTATQDTISLNGEKLNVTEMACADCTLKKEHFNLVLKLEAPWNKKDVLFLDSKSWVKESKNDDDDEAAIERIRNPIVKMLADVASSIMISHMSEESSFQGRMEGTFDMAKIYVTSTAIISPTVKVYIPTGTIRYVFFERMSSYQKNFDLTFAGIKSVHQINAVNRKEFYRKVLNNIVKKYEMNYYEGGPDPLPWNQLLKAKQRENKTWQEMIDTYLQLEEVEEEEASSDWEDESEDEEEDDDDDFDACVDEEEEEEEEIEEESESDDDDFERDEDGYLTSPQGPHDDEDSDCDEPPAKKTKH